MKPATLFISFIIFLLSSCNNSSEKENDTVVDSVIALKDDSYTDLLTDLSGTRDLQTLLSQGWEMEDDIEVLRNNNDAEGNYPFRCFYLSNDSTFIKNPRNYMEYGKWSFDKQAKVITLKTASGSKDEYKLAALGANEMVVINSGIKSVTKLKYVSAGKQYKNNSDNPYYIDNNRWRIKPRFSENDSLIKKRLKACLHFYVLFYRDNLAKQENIISFYGLPTCLRWYKGGIYLVKKDDLADNWFGCFYSKDEALKAWKMMDQIIGKKYTWSKDKISWVKKNLQVLEQMYANL